MEELATCDFVCLIYMYGRIRWDWISVHLTHVHGRAKLCIFLFDQLVLKD